MKNIRIFSGIRGVFPLAGLFLFMIIVLTACANYGAAPGGGPKDETPPALVQSLPAQGTVNLAVPAKIQLKFNEYVVLQNTDKIVVSPPLQKISFSSNLKQVTVSIDEDSLPANTTYNINFKESIGDLHEGIPARDFTYLFSTGSTIDSAQLSGIVLDAFNLEPIKEASVLLYVRKPQDFPPAAAPDYVGTTSDKGTFCVRYMKEGCYYVFAVKEGYRDYKIDPNEEMMAYSDLCWGAAAVRSRAASGPADSLASVGADSLASVGADSLASVGADSLASVGADSLASVPTLNILYLYQDYEDRKFLKEAVFPARGEIRLSWYYIGDSVAFEIIDNADDTASVMENLEVCRIDNPAALQSTLYFNDYSKTDILLVVHVGPYTDTAELSLPTAVRKKQDTAQFKVSVRNSGLCHTDSLALGFTLPVWQIDWRDAVLFEIFTDEDGRKDTSRTEVSRLHPVQSNPVTVILNYAWKPGADYRLFLPSSCFIDFLGRGIDTTLLQFSTTSLENYGEMAVTLQGLESGKRYILQLTDAGGKTVFAQQPVTQDGLYVFPYVKPGSVTFVLFEDPNGNALWDRGHYSANRRPERRFYYPKTIQAEADWRIEETWLLR